MREYPSDVAFTPAVKAVQARKGSRGSYSRMERGDGWETTVTPELASFVAGLNLFSRAPATAGAQPYTRSRGAPPGFLRVLEGRPRGSADFGGNRQYVTLGNLSENP